MDAVYVGAIALLFAVTWAMAAGCAHLGSR